MKKWIAIGVLALATCMAVPSTAQQGGRRAQLAQRLLDRRMAHIKQELKLTPEQEPALRGILTDNAKQTRELRNKYGRKDPALRKELRAMHDATQEKLKSVLNEDQLARFRELRRQRLDQARTRGKG